MDVIEFLNSPADPFAWISIVVAWFLLWHLIIKRLLQKCEATSFWYSLCELGALGTLGILIFLSLIAGLFVASIQAVRDYGVKALFALICFWGLMTSACIWVAKQLRNGK